MEKEKDIDITLKIGDKTIMYKSYDSFNDDRRMVYFLTNHSVFMNAKMPENWGVNRIIQFMESVVNVADKII